MLQSLRSCFQRCVPFLLCAVFLSACAGYQRAEAYKGSASKPVVYLYPFNDFPEERARVLASFLSERLGVEAVALKRLTLPRQTEDRLTRHFIAEDVVAFLRARSSYRLTDEHSYMVGLVPKTLISRDTEDAAALEYLDAPYGLISTISFEERDDKDRIIENVMRTRTEKLLAAHVGRLVLSLPGSESTSDFMYKNLSTVQDIDAVDAASIRR